MTSKRFLIVAAAIILALVLMPPAAAVQGAFGAKFEPPDGKALLIMGQDLGAVGGLPGYNQGYVDGTGVVPGGVTTYGDVTSMMGVTIMANWGSGDTCAQYLADSPVYKHSVLVLGLYMVGNEKNVAAGACDKNLRLLGEWIKAQDRPIFLRIGYEFDGDWNHYEPTAYIAAFRHIVDLYRSMGIDNCAYVWQSSGNGDEAFLMRWYPGDDFVDWCGYSHFGTFGEGMLQLARKRHKPVMIAEATPAGYRLDLGDGRSMWEGWFKSLFSHIHRNDDIIKALAYINVDWYKQSMWRTGMFSDTDSRIQVNAYIKEQWLKEITSGFWLNASPELFGTLGYRRGD